MKINAVDSERTFLFLLSLGLMLTFLSDGPSNVTISGPGSLEVGVKASFKCIAQCSPSCSYTWSVYGRTMHGSVVDITVNRYVATESFSCEAHNTITGKTATANETLSVTGMVKLL